MIKSLKLSYYRNFEKKEIEFSEKITVIVGRNAVGKTNILESLFLLSTGRSFKARIESEIIQYEKDLTRITGVLSLGSPMSTHKGNPAMGLPASRHPSDLEIILTNGENGWPKKRMLVNGVPRRLVDFAGNFKTVLFGPQDLDLVTESPSLRRKFLDTVLSQTDREYRRSILSYEKGLRQRNRLLLRIREEGLSRSQLLFWNQLLIKNGDFITKKREEFIEFCNKQKEVSDKKEQSFLSYPLSLIYSLEYDRSVISEGRLEQYAREEIATATTLVGPHRDDFVFKKVTSNKLQEIRDLSSFGSRGEQRMGVLWLKMAELDYIERMSQEAGPETNLGRPTLLLDDIFSELDHEHRKIVIDLATKQQTIMTTADEHYLEDLNVGIEVVKL